MDISMMSDGPCVPSGVHDGDVVQIIDKAGQVCTDRLEAFVQNEGIVEAGNNCRSSIRSAYKQATLIGSCEIMRQKALLGCLDVLCVQAQTWAVTRSFESLSIERDFPCGQGAYYL